MYCFIPECLYLWTRWKSFHLAQNHLPVLYVITCNGNHTTDHTIKLHSQHNAWHGDTYITLCHVSKNWILASVLCLSLMTEPGMRTGER